MKRPRVTCPGCGGEMAKGSRLCSGCRRRAIDVGVEALERSHGSPKPNRLTDGQRRAFYGKTNDLERIYGESPGTWKTHALSEASKHFGRPVEHVNDLGDGEASWVLDRLTEELETAKLAILGGE